MRNETNTKNRMGFNVIHNTHAKIKPKTTCGCTNNVTGDNECKRSSDAKLHSEKKVYFNKVLTLNVIKGTIKEM